ncbi:MAG: polyphosphate kinase 2 family protein [Methanomassiliicoccales archaeon]|jgi:PPK2 family polyphosphate:nucleotide phosphotransferase|nr:polyphosphate kinase 2 family protein [Methanomassiliicoccales archaeon]MDD1757071.1 polyphosphate kinase 2 family protein [Methanomassiliicoccales archaeon]
MGEKEPRQLIERVRVEPGKKVDLKDFPTNWSDPERFSINGTKLSKDNADELLAKSQKELTKMQDVLWASNSYSLLIILQGMDAAGKDGIIKHVMSGVNPQGCEVTSFKAPTAEEVDHDFLWRCIKVMPGKGMIGIFNRSYYEEVLVVKVHPDFLANQRLPYKEYGQSFWNERYQGINEMERHLVRNGTIVIKFFLNVSQEEQRTRLLERIETPEKRWKFNPNDVKERDLWPRYMDAYREVLESTSTEDAPWFVLPADQKWLTRVLAAQIIISEIKRLGLAYPELPKEYLKAVDEAKSRLQRG